MYDLPCGFMSEKVAKEIGKFIGVYIEADAKNFNGIWRNFMRIRVAIDVRKPLKKRMRIKKLGVSGHGLISSMKGCLHSAFIVEL